MGLLSRAGAFRATIRGRDPTKAAKGDDMANDELRATAVKDRLEEAVDEAKFETELGPVFCNFLLADEINRAPAKVQSALLEVMQEHQVTIGPQTFPVPDPFLVMATQNPIESEGVYPLPEAQVDRFML